MIHLNEEEKSNLEKISILYVEDEELILNVVTSFLEKYVQNLYVCSDGEVGLQLFKEHRPDIVITDLRMPKVSGLEMTKEIRKIKPSTQVIITTAYDEREFFLEAIELGINEYLIKPVEREILLKMINKCAHTILLEQQLREVDHQREMIINAASEGIFGLDREGRHTFVNPAAAAMLGYEMDELIGQHSHATWHHSREDGSYFSEEECPIYRTLNRAVSVKVEEDVFWRKDGSFFYADYAANPIIKNGKNVGAVVTFWDVSSRIQSEKELSLLSLAVDQSVNMIVITDTEGHFEYVNESFCKITGFSRQEILGNKPNVLKSDKNDPKIYDAMWETIQQGNTWVGELINRTKQGTLYWANLAIYPLKNDHNQIIKYVGIAEDVTERKYFELKLQNINIELEKQIEDEVRKNRDKDRILFEQAKHAALGEVIKDIAHHWRQPLTAIGMLVHNIKDAYEYGELTDEYLEDITTKTTDQLQQLSKTIDNFRSFFKPAEEESDIDVQKTLEDVLFMLSGQMNNFFITTELTGKTGLQIRGFPNEFKQVAVNIIKNSMDSIIQKRNEVNNRFRGKITIEIREEDTQIAILFMDNGLGIPSDQIEHIFDPYFTTKKQSSGAGMGLYMSKMVIEKNMGGSLEVCGLDEGVEFIVKLNKK